VAGTLLLGMLFVLSGVIDTFSALEQAQPEQKAALVARGLSLSLGAGFLSILLGGIQAFLGSIAVTVRSNLRKR
jgi:uncharacterized membrane protein HdeD (DUF308 family)